MQLEGWKYYNHAMIPTTAPHESVNLEPINNGSIWKTREKYPFIARWHSDWDCGFKTNWWFTILDEPFDINSVNSHYRNRIKKGIKTFYCRRIEPCEYAEEMASIAMKDFKTYANCIRPLTTKGALINEYKSWSYITFGAFDKDGQLCAFLGINDCGSYYEMIQGKSIPERQRGQLNASLIYTFITTFSNDIAKGKYISNGQRNINHITNFNEDLCKYYGFRKAYCKLNMMVNPKYKIIVDVLRLFKRILTKFDGFRYIHQINAVLKMEDFISKDEKLFSDYYDK